MRASSRSAHRGGFFLGAVVGLLIGLALALGVALYVTKVPLPFIDKVPQRTADQDAAEAERNRNWNPNAPLSGRAPAPAASGAVALPPPGVVLPPPVPAPGARDPAAILADQPPVSTATPPPAFSYFVQAGAYSRSEEAEAQRARLAIQGFESRISEREQSGRTVYRVRVGPFSQRGDAETVKETLEGAGIAATLARVQQ